MWYLLIAPLMKLFKQTKAARSTGKPPGRGDPRDGWCAVPYTLHQAAEFRPDFRPGRTGDYPLGARRLALGATTPTLHEHPLRVP